MIELKAHHTHLYPGAEISVEAPVPPGAHACELTFSDQSVAMGQCHVADEGHWRLAVLPYTTAANTQISARNWLVELHDDARRLKVVRLGDDDLVS